MVKKQPEKGDSEVRDNAKLGNKNRQKVPVTAGTFKQFAVELKLLSERFEKLAPDVAKRDNSALTILGFAGARDGIKDVESLVKAAEFELQQSGESCSDRILRVNVTC